MKCTDAKKDILDAVLNLWTNQHALIQAEREKLKEEVMINGEKISDDLLNQALQMLKLGNIPFQRKATIDVEQKKGYIKNQMDFSHSRDCLV